MRVQGCPIQSVRVQVSWVAKHGWSIFLQKQNLITNHIGCFPSRDEMQSWDRSEIIHFVPLKPIIPSSLHACTWRKLERKCKQGERHGSGAVTPHWQHPAATSENILNLKHAVTSGVQNKWVSCRGIYLTGRYNHKPIFYCYKVSVFGFHHCFFGAIRPREQN